MMRQEGIVARKKRRFRKTTDSKHAHPIAPNVLARNFNVELPDTAWVTAVTYVWTDRIWELHCWPRSMHRRVTHPSVCG